MILQIENSLILLTLSIFLQPLSRFTCSRAVLIMTSVHVAAGPSRDARRMLSYLLVSFYLPVSFATTGWLMKS